jgi:hypothetical protein
MKLFMSSPPSFNTWMSVCTLSVTLLGLPMAAVAEEACVITSARNVVCDRLATIYVHHTQWMVESAENGCNGDYHPVSWSFSPDGTVRAGNLWRGT